MDARAGLFGKTPRYGDFLMVGMTPERRQAWDDWISLELSQAREALGEAWDTAHDQAPCWRFLADRQADGWVAGALAPSIDAAGRRFVLAVEIGGLDRPVALAGGGALCQAAEDLIYAAIADRLEIDALTSGLTALAAQADGPESPAWSVLDPTTTAPGVWWTAGGPSCPPTALAAGWPLPGLSARMFCSGAQEAAA
jgi:type VI secretion system protein ImpM